MERTQPKRLSAVGAGIHAAASLWKQKGKESYLWLTLAEVRAHYHLQSRRQTHR